MRLFPSSLALLILTFTIHPSRSFDIRDAFKLNWRFHSGHTAHEDSPIHEITSKSTGTSSDSHQGQGHADNHEGHWIPPKLKLGVNVGIIGGKWPFFWTWKSKHNPVTYTKEMHTEKLLSHPKSVHHVEYSSAPVAISIHPNVPNIHQTNHNSIIKPEEPQQGSVDGAPITSEPTLHSLPLNSQPPQRFNSHAEWIIRNFGIRQNQVDHHNLPENHNFQSSPSLANSNIQNDHHSGNNMDSYAFNSGNIFPTGGNSFTHHSYHQPYDNSHHMQSLPEIIQSSSTNNLPVAKPAVPIISHRTNLPYSTIYSTQPKLQSIQSESQHLTSLASVNYPGPLNPYLSHLPDTKCFDCHIPYTRGSLTHALISDIQNLPTTEDDKLIKALQVILAVAQEEARQRNQFREQQFMRKR